MSNLRLRPQGLSRFITSFERPNLHFSVRRKSGLAADLSELVGEKEAGREVEATVVYALTTKVGGRGGGGKGIGSGAGHGVNGCVVCLYAVRLRR